MTNWILLEEREPDMHEYCNVRTDEDELGTIRTQAGDATEYVLAQINQELRSRLHTARAALTEAVGILDVRYQVADDRKRVHRAMDVLREAFLHTSSGGAQHDCARWEQEHRRDETTEAAEQFLDSFGDRVVEDD